MLTTDTILGAAAVSDLLQCSEKQAEELMRDRELAATKIGRGWVTTYAHVLAFLNDRIASARPATRPCPYCERNRLLWRKRMAEVERFELQQITPP